MIMNDEQKRRCAGCEEYLLSSNCVDELDQKWHKNCFKCSTCAKVLDPNKFSEKYNKPYCSDGKCLELAGGRIVSVTLDPSEQLEYWIYCDRCDKTIERDVVKAGGRFYHKLHFTCDGCKCEIPAAGECFFVFGQPYCTVDCCKKYILMDDLDEK